MCVCEKNYLLFMEHLAVATQVIVAATIVPQDNAAAQLTLGNGNWQGSRVASSSSRPSRVSGRGSAGGDASRSLPSRGSSLASSGDASRILPSRGSGQD